MKLINGRGVNASPKHKGRLVRDTMKIFKIYKYTNLITGMSYIGQTCKPLSTRAGHNMQNYCGCEKFWEAIQNYGTDCWSVEILWDGLTP